MKWEKQGKIKTELTIYLQIRIYTKTWKIDNAYIICMQHGITDAPHGSISSNSNNNSSCPTRNHYCTLAVNIHLFNGSIGKANTG
jgi:hypothetical protein